LSPTTSVCFTIYFISISHIQIAVSIASIGLISQVANDLWEVKDKTIKNLTKDDISIVDYKSKLVRQSQHLLYLASWSPLISCSFRSSCTRKSQVIQQDCGEREDMKVMSSRLPTCTPISFLLACLSLSPSSQAVAQYVRLLLGSYCHFVPLITITIS